MKKSGYIVRTLAIMMVYLLSSCNMDEGPFATDVLITDEVVQDSVVITNSDTTRFSTDVQSIFDSYCISCHSEAHAKLNLKACCSFEELTSIGFSAPYINPSNPDVSNIYRHLIGELSMMPPSGQIPQYELDMIYSWIEQGGQNN